jgi:hypothetical protein
LVNWNSKFWGLGGSMVTRRLSELYVVDSKVVGFRRKSERACLVSFVVP